MTSPVDLKALERRAYFSYHQDGLLDIFIGLWFLGFGFGVIYCGMAGVLPALALPLWMGAKKLVTVARLGHVAFSPQRKVWEKKNLTVLTLVGCATFAGGIVSFVAFTGGAGQWKAMLRDMGMIPFGAILALLAIVVALLFGFKRLYAYAGLILIVFIGGHMLDVHPVANFALPGAVILVYGLSMLLKFLKKYPAPAEEVSQ